MRQQQVNTMPGFACSSRDCFTAADEKTRRRRTADSATKAANRIPLRMAFRSLPASLLFAFWGLLPIIFTVADSAMPSGRNLCSITETLNQTMKDKLIRQFQENARQNTLTALLARHSTCNLALPTLQGLVFWQTVEENGWKLQFHVLFENWRILDCKGIRRAWGIDLQELADLLSDQPTSIVANYFDPGYQFSFTPAAKNTGQTVLLLHGWGVRGKSMQPLATALAGAGFQAFNYDYPSSEHSIEEHSTIFLGKLQEKFRELPADEKIHLLTHSMGGLILRMALAKLTPADSRKISSIVMLGPPNRGSLLAILGDLPAVKAFNASLADMKPDANSPVMNIPNPEFLPPTGIIAGTRDGKVRVEDTRLPDPLPFRHITVNCTHPGLRDPENVLPLILSFFNTHEFNQ